jgi:predicted DNA-binding protein (MmcQ/YjbR family)
VNSESEILKKLRKVCLALPHAEETVSFRHPAFRARGGKIFAVLETYKGELGICVNVGRLIEGMFLDDPRFFRTPYIGRLGWVTLRVYAARLNWKEIRELVKGSYLLGCRGARKKSKVRAGRGDAGVRRSKPGKQIGQDLPGSSARAWSACSAMGESG